MELFLIGECLRWIVVLCVWWGIWSIRWI